LRYPAACSASSAALVVLHCALSPGTRDRHKRAPKTTGMVTLTTIFTKTLGVIFALIAGVMLLVPDANLAQDGVPFASFPTAGKAEVRAYYVGTALCVSWSILSSEAVAALRAIAVVLGGFASARVYGYAVDGVDADAALRMHQHAVFIAEVAGCTMALVLLAAQSRIPGARKRD